ncbi:MAG TPA: hypothetical protein VIW80_22640 [Pyrinomonadaceae bacterium]|jgi:hypothetical protein
MSSGEHLPNRAECHICHTALSPDSAFCPACGASSVERNAEELRAVLYLLSELERWQAQGSINPAEAGSLRSVYERRRDDLRSLLTASAEDDVDAERVSDAQATSSTSSQTETMRPSSASSAVPPAAAPSIRFPLSRSPAQPPPTRPPTPEQVGPRRPLVETLTEPYTLRLLLYTGAAMFVVGIIIWLRDVLYLKLQEPVVQAGLLMLGTIVLIASGWFTILRTRQRFTGRALTLAGSLLVPVNFWFLVRSGLIADQGRAWMVCAFCALLYAGTAALLGEKLYVYMACAASVATPWALVYRFERQAPGLYALALMFAALVFLHLARMFPETFNALSEAAEGEASQESKRATNAARAVGELWSNPLTQAAITGACLAALVYMPLRLGPSLSLYDGIFRLRAQEYASSTGIFLFIALGYTAWFAGRYLNTRRRVALYTTSLIALLWAVFLILDGLRLRAEVQILLLATSMLAVSLAARRARSLEFGRAFYLASVFAGLMLMPVAFAVLLAAEQATFIHGAGFALLAVAFASLSAPRLGPTATQIAFAYASALLASTGFLVALLSASLTSQTLFTAACAAWPFALYGVAFMTERQRLETQLAAPFIRTADVESSLLLLWASFVSLVLYLSEANIIVPRAAMFCALGAPLLYGFLRVARERNAFGAGLSAIASVVIVASSLDALQDAGIWPRSWPIAAGVICAAFALHKAGARWLRASSGQEQDGGGGGQLYATGRVVLDAAVVLCALLWFMTALFDRGGFGAAFVLLLALVYWGERAAQSRTSWPTYMSAAHAGAFFLALLIALDTDRRWFAALAAMLLAPLFFAVGGYARSRRAVWLAGPASNAAIGVMTLSFIAAIAQAMPHLQAGDPALLAPAVAIAALAIVSFVVSMLWGEGVARVRYFRAGLYLGVIAYALLCLRAGFEPLVDVEVYTSPIAVLLLAVAYISFRREWGEYERDTSLLFWTGSILLAGPLLLRALQFRLLMDMAAPWRDLATLCASLALLVFGILGRLRAPVLVGAATLLIELAALTLTSVDWLQVPLKIYLVTVGALLALVGWMFEYRREQLMLIRNRFNERRATARARFNAWR